MRVDLGDIVAVLELQVRGRRRHVLNIRVGVPRDTTAADRVVKGPPYTHNPRKAGPIVDLQADKLVPLALTFTDEVGNPVDTPADASVTWSVDDPTLINLTDNGDGTATAAAVGPLGSAFVHVEAAFGGETVSGDLGITVVAGLAERVTITAGEPAEVTPDEAEEPPVE